MVEEKPQLVAGGLRAASQVVENRNRLQVVRNQTVVGGGHIVVD